MHTKFQKHIARHRSQHNNEQNQICGVVGSKEEQQGRDPEAMQVQPAIPLFKVGNFDS